MNITSKTLAALVIVMIFGGIMVSSALGLWQTTTTKEPAKFTEGEFAGQANPADIRGSYTFGDIEKNFGISGMLLAKAFGVSEGEPDAFQVKGLEELYASSEFEIGTNSVRLFVAFYNGQPYDLSTDIYMPESAAELLLERNLDPERLAYLQAHTVPNLAAGSESALPPATAPEATPTPQTAPAAETPVTASTNMVKGKTTFGELLSWGVPQAAIEQIIGGPLPEPSITAKDYCTAKGLSFETIKTQLQAEVDKVKK